MRRSTVSELPHSVSVPCSNGPSVQFQKCKKMFEVNCSTGFGQQDNYHLFPWPDTHQTFKIFLNEAVC
jgi:hypothetical protein